MRKRFLTVFLAAALSVTSVFTALATPQSAEAATKKLTAKQKKEKADKAAAAKVADLIDRIYVQDNEKAGITDADLKKAKLQWDLLTKAQKKLVSGVNASPDYYGLDTGDATEDNPLNWNYIGENEILVVSFGTSYNESRTEDIGGVERALEAYAASTGWSVRRAFTSQIIINHIASRDGEKIDNVKQALERAVKNGVKNLVVAPTHLMNGKEYDDLVAEVEAYKDRFTTVTYSEPMLGVAGETASSVNTDKETVAKAVVAQTLSDYKGGIYKSAAEAKASGTAIVLMGHGTSHTANITYAQMQAQMGELGYENVFVGTVEGVSVKTEAGTFEPDCQAVIAKIKAAGYKNVVLRPLMVVAGDHANNDMAGNDADSWKKQFAKVFGSKNVSCQIAGLGRIEGVEQVYIDHLRTAISGNPALKDLLPAESGRQAATASSVAQSLALTASAQLPLASSTIQTASVPVAAKSTSLKNGTYTVGFAVEDDLGMIGMNDALDGKTTLKVKKGVMTVHVPMKGSGLTKAFVGTAKKAAKTGAKTIKGVSETVGEETVIAFDIPVKQLNKSFNLSFYSKRKKKWYQKTVKVTYDA